MEKEKLFDLFNEENIEGIKNLIQEINNWNGSLDYLEYFENDESFFKDYFSDVFEAVRATQYGEYSFSDEYVHFNAYGNLDSCSEWELEEEITNNLSEIFDIMLEELDNIDISCLSDEFVEALEEYQENEEA